MKIEVAGLTWDVDDPSPGEFTRFADRKIAVKKAYEAGVVVGIKAARKAHEAARNKQRENELMKANHAD